MSTTDRHDHDLEAQLRAVLTQRAGRITGAPPELDDLPLVGVTPAPLSRSAASRTPRAVRWVAAAAVVGVIGVAAGNALQTDTPTISTGADPGPSSVPSTPPDPSTTDSLPVQPSGVAPELPASVQLDVVTPIFSADGDAEAVARAYLADRFGDDVAEVEQRLASELAFATTSSPVVGITALGYDQDGDGLEELPKGTVFLREDPGGWQVVAAVTPGLSLASIQRDGSRLHGPVIGDLSNNVGSGSVITTEAGQEPQLPGSGAAEIDTEAGDSSVLVTAWSAGGRTLALTEFVSDPAVRPKVLWAGSADDRDQRRDPESAARAYAAAAPTPLPVRSTEVVEPLDRPTDTAVRLTLDGGLFVTLDLARTTDGWVVVNLQDSTDLSAAGGAETTGPDGVMPVRSIRLGVPDTVVSADLTTWVADEPTTVTLSGDAIDAGPDSAHVEQPGMNYLLAEIDPPQAISHSLLIGRDSRGTVVTVQATFWA